ncbi:zinc ribbon domain-containing protein [Mesorhizobium sp. M0715]|uniref:zinc ribbon domain-containing protein n=1 Tax=Mesorhizobium sp. M0715 TaxID=2956990 RepID=UPI00333D91FD
MEGDTKTCPECAETVQRDARICRFCRHDFRVTADPAAENRKLARWLILPALAVLVWVGLHKGGNHAEAPKVAGTNICKGWNGQQVLDQARDAGIIRNIRRSSIGTINGAFVEVITARWAMVSTKIHVGIAMAAYCQVAAADGIGVAMVKGSLEEDLGSVVDGNWMR